MNFNKIQKHFLLVTPIFISLLFSSVVLMAIVLLSPRASASIVTCNDGTVHAYPDMDYDCWSGGHGGMASIAPYTEEPMRPGDICPEHFAREGEPIPNGRDGTWCGEVSAAQLACQRGNGFWSEGRCDGASTTGPTAEEQCQADGGVWKSDIARCVPYQPQTNDCQGTNPTSGEVAGSENHCGILNYIALIINVLAVLAGIVITIAIIAGGIQYSSAGSDPQKVSAARGRIRNAIIALILLVFGYGLLNYLVPGGVM